MDYKKKNFYINKSIEENLEYIYSLELDDNISNKERIINISTYIFYAQEEYNNDYFNKMYDMLNISRLTNDTIVTILRIANITRLGPIDRYKEIYLYIKNELDQKHGNTKVSKFRLYGLDRHLDLSESANSTSIIYQSGIRYFGKLCNLVLYTAKAVRVFVSYQTLKIFIKICFKNISHYHLIYCFFVFFL